MAVGDIERLDNWAGKGERGVKFPLLFFLLAVDEWNGVQVLACVLFACTAAWR